MSVANNSLPAKGFPSRFLSKVKAKGEPYLLFNKSAVMFIFAGAATVKLIADADTAVPFSKVTISVLSASTSSLAMIETTVLLSN